MHHRLLSSKDVKKALCTEALPPLRLNAILPSFYVGLVDRTTAKGNANSFFPCLSL